jgi:purine-binding chemotaxis protein CheW
MPECTKEIQAQRSAGAHLAGKYLTFTLGIEEFGLEILKVREIIGYMDITAVPRAPHYVKGVINLRGQVIPVIDMRSKFEMEAVQVTEQTCIIVVEVASGCGKFNVGIVVDSVREVLDIEEEDIEPTPQFDGSVDTSFILGMGKIEGAVKILLDIDKVLQVTELEPLSDSSAAGSRV